MPPAYVEPFVCGEVALPVLGALFEVDVKVEVGSSLRLLLAL